MSLSSILKKYSSKKLFEIERDQFKEEFFEELFDPYLPVDYSYRTTVFINAILEEENLPYVAEADYEETGIHKDEKYWVIRKL
jgi:hypothetical protein